jgi:hypothetical protein
MKTVTTVEASALGFTPRCLPYEFERDGTRWHQSARGQYVDGKLRSVPFHDARGNVLIVVNV